MLNFRDLDYSRDVVEVVTLIRENLQPEYTEEFFLWKHVQNPFGKSIAMVATESGKIVGVVFYMRYDLKRRDGSVIKCIRPFDGCTDTKLRGRGIFKKLMVACLEQYNKDYELLLANPNNNSYPEFLKLGWLEPSQKYYYKIGIISPSIKLKSQNLVDVVFSEEEKDSILNYQNYAVVGNSLKFVQWRYKSEDYRIKKYSSNKTDNYIIYRIGKIKNISCVILCDYYGDLSNINNVIKEVCALEKLYLVYYLSNQITDKIKFLFSFNQKRAIIVYKENEYHMSDDMVISLGDMEGRL